MPTYEYLCISCGPFEAGRRMAEAHLPNACPDCGEAAPRAILSPVNYAGMDPHRRTAMATNERSRHEPKVASQTHGKGCACCTPKASGAARADGTKAVKSFPAARPWMISH